MKTTSSVEEEKALLRLSEEAGELAIEAGKISQIASKISRFGYHNVHKKYGPQGNMERLEQAVMNADIELADIMDALKDLKKVAKKKGVKGIS